MVRGEGGSFTSVEDEGPARALTSYIDSLLVSGVAVYVQVKADNMDSLSRCGDFKGTEDDLVVTDCQYAGLATSTALFQVVVGSKERELLPRE